MTLYRAIILAILQGLTEFLPVSSSAHLILIPKLLHWPDQGLAFDVALHAGTLVAILLYFLRDWIDLTLAGLGFNYPPRAGAVRVQHNRRMFWYLVAATIPGAVAGFLFEKQIEEKLRDPKPIALAMILIALLMWYAEYMSKLDRRMEDIGFGDSILIGTAQAAALFPGVSRSDHHHDGIIPRTYARGRRAVFIPALNTNHRGRGRERTAQVDQAAPGGAARYAAFDAGHRRCRFRDFRLPRHRVFSALLADTDLENLYLLPDRVWYSHPRTRVPPDDGLRALAPAHPVAIRPSPALRETSCAS